MIVAEFEFKDPGIRDYRVLDTAVLVDLQTLIPAVPLRRALVNPVVHKFRSPLET